MQLKPPAQKQGPQTIDLLDAVALLSYLHQGLTSD